MALARPKAGWRVLPYVENSLSTKATLFARAQGDLLPAVEGRGGGRGDLEQKGPPVPPQPLLKNEICVAALGEGGCRSEKNTNVFLAAFGARS